MSARLHEHETMERLLREVGAAGHFDVAITRFAAAVDLIGTDDSGQRLANHAHAAILDALIHTARQHGWAAPRPIVLKPDPRLHRAPSGVAAVSRPG